MRTIIAGSRTITDYNKVVLAIRDSGFNVTTVLSGCANGVDRLGERWAKEHEVPLERYPADWDQFGKKAGWKRNQEMANKAAALIAIWDGESRGTTDMVQRAMHGNLRVCVITVLPKNQGEARHSERRVKSVQ